LEGASLADTDQVAGIGQDQEVEGRDAVAFFAASIVVDFGQSFHIDVGQLHSVGSVATAGPGHVGNLLHELHTAFDILQVFTEGHGVNGPLVGELVRYDG